MICPEIASIHMKERFSDYRANCQFGLYKGKNNKCKKKINVGLNFQNQSCVKAFVVSTTCITKTATFNF